MSPGISSKSSEFSFKKATGTKIKISEIFKINLQLGDLTHKDVIKEVPADENTPAIASAKPKLDTEKLGSLL